MLPLRVLPVLAATALLPLIPAAASAAPTSCTAASGLLYAGNDGATYAVQARPINERGIGMRAEPDGLHLSLSGGAQDADVVFASTTLGAIIDGGVPVKASSNIVVNLWFDTNRNSHYFDLAADGTGTFTGLAGDDYGSVSGGMVSKLGGAALPAAPTKLTDLDAATKGAINRDTKVAVVAVLQAPQTAGTVTSVGGVQASVCTSPTPTPTPTPTAAPAPTNTATTPPNSATPVVLPPLTATPAGGAQVAVVPSGVNTGRA